MSGLSGGEFTRLLLEARAGSSDAAGQVFARVYAELKAIAQRALRGERAGHTLQATALVHEAYLKLVEQREVEWQGRVHFLAIAAQAMRRVLVDHARARAAAKRGGGRAALTLADSGIDLPAADIEFEALNEALERLGAVDAQQARLVELRFFGGLRIEETAAVLDVSPATVKRDWALAKAWLYRELTKG
jgi:RNA polymerase sigma factor (TIGR02999 family)